MKNCTLVSSLLLALFLFGLAPAVNAAHLGLYGDPQGTLNRPALDVSQAFSRNWLFVDIYVVLFTEDTVSAVAFDLEVAPDVGYTSYFSQSWYGPDQNGISLDTPEGHHVGLGTCLPGFGGLPVVVAQYRYLLVFPDRPSWTGSWPWSAELLPSTREHPTFPVYSRCSGDVVTIEDVRGISFWSDPIPTATDSWGAVKAVYQER